MPLRGKLALSLRALTSSPGWLQRALVGAPIRLDGQQLDLEVQVMLACLANSSSPPLESLSPEAARAQVARETRMLAGAPPKVACVEPMQIDCDAGALAARLYVPAEATAQLLPLLVYFHGGGFVVGDLDTHDHTCRFIARNAGVLVLAVDYRLAPEHPFPAAVQDALAAFLFATEHARQIGADPHAIAVGGDSAGGNLAAVVCQQSPLIGIAAPAYQWLLYPITDLAERHRSYELFSDGFLLTAGQMGWFRSNYLGDQDVSTDPCVSPLRAPHLDGLPPAYIATAGFDVLRDEGEEYARLLDTAGTPVTLRRYRGLVHGFATSLGAGRFATRALGEAVIALRTALPGARDPRRR